MDINKIADWFEYLKGPEPVAKFQQKCGIRLVMRERKAGEETGKEVSSAGVVEEVEFQNKLLHWLFLFGTSLGDETFYSVFFTFWFWSVDSYVGRRMVLVWGICMYIGQSLKDIIRWPRPASPPVVKLERKWELEYGMPSTHAIVGAAVPATIIYFTFLRYEYSGALGVVIALTICSLVCTSRIYLGMHSVLDIIAGLSLVACLLPIVLPLVHSFDQFLFRTEVGGLTLIGGGLFLCICYPTGDRWTPARGDTFVILGSAIGLTLGSWTNYQLGMLQGPPPSNPPYAVMWPTANMIMLALVRQVLGLVLVLTSKIVAKAVANFIIRRQPDDSLKKPGFVTELFTKFFTYATVGFTVTYFAPNVFRLLSIERPSFHTEV